MRIAFTFIFICIGIIVQSQCLDQIYENCQDPIPECDLNVINGFLGCTPEYNGAILGTMCSGQAAIHNPAYFSFVAGSSSISVTVGVENCDMVGGVVGLQANIIDYCNPDICYGDSGGACFDSQFSFEANDLIVGEVYQLVVDGCNGNVCEFELSIDTAPPFEIVSIDNLIPTNLNGQPDGTFEQGEIVLIGTSPSLSYESYYCWNILNMQGVTIQNESNQCNVAWNGSQFSCASGISSCGPLELIFSEVGDYVVCLVEMNTGCDGQLLNVCSTIQIVPSSNNGSCLGSPMVSGAFGSFENTDGPNTDEITFQIDDCDLVCFSMDFSTNGQAWEGNSNLEAAEECSFNEPCLGDPLNSLQGDCNACWDFLYARFYIGDSIVYENLLGDSIQDELDGTWSIMVEMANFPGVSDGRVVVVGQTFASNENLSYHNLTVSCLDIEDNDGDGFDNSVDCDDTNANINPSATEICDNVDNNCDGQIDEGLTVTYYADNDGDGFGDLNNSIESCTGQVGYVLDNTDCDDSNENINPDAFEIASNGIDDNCDGFLDMDDPCLDPILLCDLTELDGLTGDLTPSFSGEVLGVFCAGFVLNNPVYYEFVSTVDSFRFNLSVFNCVQGLGLQAAIIDPCDSGFCYTDIGGECISDVSTFIVEGLTIGNTYQLLIDGCAGDSCSYEVELLTNVVSQTSFQTYFLDQDGDGYGDPNISVQDCTAPMGYTLNNTDCDDSNPNINEAAIEIPNNGIDENCDGIDEIQGEDQDGDGYFDNDCDDTNPNINPGAMEECDGVDNNCDGVIDEGFTLETYYIDADMDGYGAGTGFTDCLQPPDTSTEGGDCDDENPDINPGASEIPNNTVDENCDGEALIIDLDGDGWNSDLDCDDTNAAINPAATEVGGNGIDEDCDGVDGPSALQQIDGFEIELFPNPVVNELIIKTNSPNLNYELYSIEGQVIIYGSVNSRSIDLAKLNNGIYLVKILNKDRSEYLIHKLVKI